MHILFKITWIPALIVLLFLVHHLIVTTAPSRPVKLRRVAKGSVSNLYSSTSFSGADFHKVQRLGTMIRIN